MFSGNLKSLSVLACVLMSGYANAATNVAANLSESSYSQSSAYLDQDAQELFNGGGWNAGNYGIGWVQADLATSFDLASVKYTISMQPDGQTWQAVYVSDNPIGHDWASLTPVASYSGQSFSGQVVTLSFAASGRYVEIVSYGGPSWTALYDASVTAVPEPETYAMLLAGLGLIGASARRRKGL